jgi:hypothetical protein
MNNCFRLCIGLLVICTFASAAFADNLYVINSAGQFGKYDLAANTFTVLNPSLGNAIGITSVGTDIFVFSDVFSGGTFVEGRLYKVDGTTGAATLIGTNNTNISVAAGLADGSFYGIGYNSELYSVNLTTAVTSLIGTSSVPAIGSCGYGNSLAGNGTTLYYTQDLFNGCTEANTMFAINPVTAASSMVGLTGIPDILGSGYDDGTLYSFRATANGSDIYSLDTTTGVGTFVKSAPANLGVGYGAREVTPVPEPSNLLLLGSGLAGLAGTIRRKLNR